MKLFSTTRKEKVFIAIGVIVAALLIGFGTWRDLHPAKKTSAGKNSFNRTYYAGNQSNFEKIPQNSYAMAVLAGTFTGKDGKNSFVPSDITPITVPQREADLLFRIDGIPTQLNAFYTPMDEAIEKWHAENNFFNTVFLQDIGEKDDIEALDSLCLAIRNHLERNYSLNVFIRRGTLEKMKDPVVFLENMNKNIWLFIFDTAEAQKPDEDLAQMIIDLNKYEAPFLVAVHTKPNAAALLARIKDKAKYFQGFLLMTPEAMQQEPAKWSTK